VEFRCSAKKLRLVTCSKPAHSRSWISTSRLTTTRLTNSTTTHTPAQIPRRSHLFASNRDANGCSPCLRNPTAVSASPNFDRIVCGARLRDAASRSDDVMSIWLLNACADITASFSLREVSHSRPDTLRYDCEEPNPIRASTPSDSPDFHQTYRTNLRLWQT
jgi:hypothetical protein